MPAFRLMNERGGAWDRWAETGDGSEQSVGMASPPSSRVLAGLERAWARLRAFPPWEPRDGTAGKAAGLPNLSPRAYAAGRRFHCGLVVQPQLGVCGLGRLICWYLPLWQSEV
jgi:hypothetical protein